MLNRVEPDGPSDESPSRRHSGGGTRSLSVVVSSTNSRFLTTALAIVVPPLVVFVGVIGYLVMSGVSEAERETAHNVEKYERDLQRVDREIAFVSRRRRLVHGMRDEIMHANRRVDRDEAQSYAEYVLQASDKYPPLPPLLLLAVGIVESGFRSDAVSAADARGLYQIWPGTGKHLARQLGWEYSKEMLFDPEKNTEMAALYLDILYATYNDPSLVLAEYNGGPRNASRLRAGDGEVATETRDYVGKVLKVYKRLGRELEGGTGGQRATSIYRSRSRRGKTLALASSPGGSGSSRGGD
jgi:hypothetical protein